jgi:hypothetical protein
VTESRTIKKLAGVVGIGAVLFASAACTKTIEGTPTAAPVTKKSTEGETVQAPDESYIYDDGTVVTLTGAAEDNSISGLLDSEVGRVLSFTVENKSKKSIDLSQTRSDADVDCEGSNQYVFPSKDFGGPEELGAGDSGEYKLNMGLVKEDVGKTCTITFPFEAEEAGSGTSVATFELVL